MKWHHLIKLGHFHSRIMGIGYLTGGGERHLGSIFIVNIQMWVWWHHRPSSPPWWRSLMAVKVRCFGTSSRASERHTCTKSLASTLQMILGWDSVRGWSITFGGDHRAQWWEAIVRFWSRVNIAFTMLNVTSPPEVSEGLRIFWFGLWPMYIHT